MKTPLVRNAPGIVCLRVSCLLLIMLLVQAAGAMEESDRLSTDEELLEFLGAMDEELDDWNEFFDMAEEGAPPEFAEVDDE